jgi:hypothetical protein
MERGGDGQQHRPRAPRFGDLDRALDSLLVAGHHDLPAVVIGRLADLPLLRLGGDRRRRLDVEAEQGRHGAHSDRHRLLHGAAANAQQPRRVGKRKRSGCRERRIFPERMTGHEGGIARKIDAGFALEHTHRGQRHGHQRGLRILRQRQALRRALPHGCAEFFAERSIDRIEHRARHREGVGERLAHADGLAPLAGKHEGDRHGLVLSLRAGP